MNFDKVRSVIEKSSRIVGFTGAGISTESGISDYRSKGGLWERFQPVYIDEFLNNKEKRKLYWERKKDQWDNIYNAEPNQGHKFYKKLHDQAKLSGLITQNIDGLHEKSGIPKGLIVNLHGNTLETKCLSCSFIISSKEVLDDLDLSHGAPLCPECNGFLKPNTISFGQQLGQNDLHRANELVAACDLLIVVGSTLIVQPAATYPLIAKQNGAKLIIINKTVTPLDKDADMVFNMSMSDFLKNYFCKL